MKNFSWQALKKWLDARHVRERVILLAAGVGIVAMAWLAFVHDAMTVAKENESRNITITNSRIAEEQNLQAEIRNTYTTDPNAFALSRQNDLREATEDADARLNQLYGELITPQQMSQVLTTILQKETMLRFRGLDNQPVEALIADNPATATDTAPAIQVYKHGLRMEFEGNFIETVYYLRSLERLDSNFFWENLEFQVTDYPNARISFDIYTYSTEKGFLGA
jgi:MSHA biogenesis protein MshJ